MQHPMTALMEAAIDPIYLEGVAGHRLVLSGEDGHREERTEGAHPHTHTHSHTHTHTLTPTNTHTGTHGDTPVDGHQIRRWRIRRRHTHTHTHTRAFKSPLEVSVLEEALIGF